MCALSMSTVQRATRKMCMRNSRLTAARGIIVDHFNGHRAPGITMRCNHCLANTRGVAFGQRVGQDWFCLLARVVV